MLRYYFVLCGMVLLPFAGPGGGRPPTMPQSGNKLSPSFTWGEVPPARGGAGLAGTYYRAAIVTEMALGARRMVTHAKQTYWCFFPDGRAYYSMPTEGLDNFNYDYVKRMNELWCCTYTLQGDQGIITWGTGGTTVPFRRSGRQLLIGRTSDAYDLLAPCDGLGLDGTYKREDWQEPISSKEGITFSRDGTFTDEGFLRGAISTWWWADRGMVEATFPPGRGTYRVANNSLSLLYSDGRKVRANFHLSDQAAKESAESFVVSTRRFVRIK